MNSIMKPSEVWKSMQGGKSEKFKRVNIVGNKKSSYKVQ